MPEMSRRAMVQEFERLRRERLTWIMVARQRLALSPVKAVARGVDVSVEARTIGECERAIKRIDQAIYALQNENAFPLNPDDEASFNSTWRGFGRL